MFCDASAVEPQQAPPFDAPQPRLQTLDQAKALTPLLLQVAQVEYDKWDESDEDTYAGGGICHLIAERLATVLDSAGIEASSVSSTFEQHVFVVCQLAAGVYTLDIPYSNYERGAGFHWVKIKGVQFDANCLDWFRVDSNPSAYLQYLD